MQLHTRAQAPKEGKAEAPREQKPVGALGGGGSDILPLLLLLCPSRSRPLKPCRSQLGSRTLPLF